MTKESKNNTLYIVFWKASRPNCRAIGSHRRRSVDQDHVQDQFTGQVTDSMGFVSRDTSLRSCHHTSRQFLVRHQTNSRTLHRHWTSRTSPRQLHRRRAVFLRVVNTGPTADSQVASSLQYEISKMPPALLPPHHSTHDYQRATVEKKPCKT